MGAGFCNWGVFGEAGTSPAGKVRKEPQALSYPLAQTPEVFPRQSVPACLLEPELGASALQHLPLITFSILIRSEGTLRGALITESVL